MSRKAALLSIVMGIALSSLATATDPYGYSKVFVDNIRCWVQIGITGVEENGDLITGTNVLLVNSAGANTDVGGPSWPTYDDAQFFRIVVKIGEEIAYDKSYDIQVGGGGEGFSSFGGGGGPVGGEYQQQFQPGDVRFASTRFDHNTNLVIEVKCYFALIAGGEWVESTKVTSTITPKPYNRVARWKSNQDRFGNTWHGSDAGTIVDINNDGLGGFVTSAKYGHDGGEVDDDHDEALQDIDPSTAIFAITHGHGDGITHSYGWDSNNAAHWLDWDEIGAVTGDSDPGLGFAWVMLYACETFTNASTVLAKFRVRTTDGVFLGFDGNLLPYAVRLDDSQIVTLAAHSDLFFQKMAAGYSASDALEETQEVYVPLYDLHPSSRLEMQLAGDGLTTLQWVYLLAGERNAISGTEKVYPDWKYIIEKQ